MDKNKGVEPESQGRGRSGGEGERES